MKPSLIRRPSGIYYVRIREHGTDRYLSTETRDKKGAEEFLSRYLAQLEPEPNLSVFAARVMTYAEATLSPKTVEIYKANIERLKKIIGDIPLKDFKPEMSVAYLAKRRKADLSPATLSIEVRTFRRIWNLGIEWELFEKNPWKTLRMQKSEVAPAFLTPEEFEQMYKAVTQKYFRDYLMLAVLTGLRRSELGFLTWDKIDLQRKCMTIETNSHFRVKHGKRRVVPIHPKAIMVLEQMERKGERLFHVDPEHFSHLFRKYRQKLKMRDELHLHSLRHTFASWLALDGIPTMDIKDLMGHSSIAVTQIYTHLPIEHLRSVVSRIDLKV